MIPIILAEEFMALRYALQTYRTVQTVHTVASYVYDADDADQMEQTLKNETQPGENLFFFVAARSLFHFIKQRSVHTTPSDEEIDDMVNRALESATFRNSMPDPQNRMAAFATAFTSEVQMKGPTLLASVRDALESAMRSQLEGSIEHDWLEHSGEVSGLKVRLNLDPTNLGLGVGPGTAELLNWVFSTPSETFGAKRVNTLLARPMHLLLAETWLSLLYHSLMANAALTSTLAGSRLPGTLSLNAVVLPFWLSSDSSKRGRQPTYQTVPITDLDQRIVTHRIMVARGYDPETLPSIPEKYSSRVGPKTVEQNLSAESRRKIEELQESITKGKRSKKNLKNM